MAVQTFEHGSPSWPDTFEQVPDGSTGRRFRTMPMSVETLGGRVPRHTFRWENVPAMLLRALTADEGVEAGGEVAALRRWYGARPDDLFVRESWDWLREDWLGRDMSARKAVVARLVDLGVGRHDGGTGKDAEMDYLRSCSNAKRLRAVVLDHFLMLGKGASAEPAAAPRAPTAKPRPAAGPARTSTDKRKPLGFEESLWKAADTLRGAMDAASYKHIVLGLVFLKYISDAFVERRAVLETELADDGLEGDDALPLLESRDEYAAEGVYWVPEPARWEALRDAAKQPDVGRRIDAAMEALEADNASLRTVLPKAYAAATVDARRLGQLVDLVSGIGLGGDEHRESDVLGRVYEYFLGKFAAAEGKNSGEFYTPRSIVRLLVEMLEPFRGRVYDPCCGSGGMFVQAERFVVEHGGRRNDIAVYGQELSSTTWRLAKMNLAIRGVEVNLGAKWADSFHEDLHPDLRADFVMANPPFNVSDWGGAQLRDDPRWQHGVPPAGNANFAWVQHMVSHLSPRGAAGIVLANGSLSTQQSGEGDIRRRLVEADLVECIVSLPGQLFYGTGIPVSLWFLNRDKTPGGSRAWRDRRGEVLFVDARALGHMVSRVHKDLSAEDIARVADPFHAWRGEPGCGEYADVPGFCRSAKLQEVVEHQHVLTPGRYVGSHETELDDEPLSDRVAQLTDDLEGAFGASNELQEAILASMERLRG